MARTTTAGSGSYTGGPIGAAPAAAHSRTPARPRAWRALLVLNAALLFLCVSMYLGTGWSLVLSFPVAPRLDPGNYYLQFVPQVEAATRFFTYMTGLMIVLALVMLIAEWRSGYRWAPIVVLLGVIAATGLTTTLIFPLNREMAGGITEQARLGEVLGRWMLLNTVRVGLWTIQWLAMMTYFALRAYRAPRTN